MLQALHARTQPMHPNRCSSSLGAMHMHFQPGKSSLDKAWLLMQEERQSGRVTETVQVGTLRQLVCSLASPGLGVTALFASFWLLHSPPGFCRFPARCLDQSLRGRMWRCLPPQSQVPTAPSTGASCCRAHPCGPSPAPSPRRMASLMCAAS